MKKQIIFTLIVLVSLRVYGQNYDITSNSIGDISYDMTLEEIQKSYAKDRAIRSYEDDSLTIALLLLDEKGRPEMKITAFNKAHSKIDNILVLSHMYKLQSGIGLGSTKGNLDAHFGTNLMFYGEGDDIVLSSDELGYIFTFHGRKEWRDNSGRLIPSLMDQETPFDTFEIAIY